MVDYVLETVDLDVFGGPTSLNISTDFGKAGERGSRFWVGSGAPELVLTTQDIKLYDLYINTNSSPDFYSWLYQYVPAVGSPSWQKVLKLNQQQYSSINLISFDDGEGILNMPLSNVTSDTTVTAAQFIVRHSFESASGFPVASSFTYSIETILGVKYLRVVFNGAQFDGTDWTSLAGSFKVHTFVSYIS
jgi:hypothetical protein